MYGLTVLLTLVIARIVVPIGLLLLIGEMVRNRERPTLKRI